MAVAASSGTRRVYASSEDAMAHAPLQEFLGTHGLLVWMEGEEGRYYLRHLCMVQAHTTLSEVDKKPR